MRTLFWCGVAVALVAGACGYWWFTHECTCPGSLLARCADYVNGGHSTPAAATSDKASDPCLVALDELDLQDLSVMESKEADYAKTLRLFDLDVLSQQPAGSRATTEEECEEPPIAEEIRSSVEYTVPVEIHAGGAEAVLFEEHMPMCIDDDVYPTVMPYADDDDNDTGPSLFDSWFGRLRKPVANGSGEESESNGDRFAPDCKEDPNYHHHYPACPYIGTCPYSGRSYTGQTESDARPMHETKKIPITDLTPPGTRAHRLSGLSNLEETDRNQAHPEVDTMEFRPSDAKNGELEKSRTRRPY
jgi:hypothetical protein